MKQSFFPVSFFTLLFKLSIAKLRFLIQTAIFGFISTCSQMPEVLDSRQEFYYGKELFYHKLYREAAAVFLHFLENPEAWLENQLDACLQLCYCYRALGENDKAMNILFKAFSLMFPVLKCAMNLEIFFWKNQLLSLLFTGISKH